MPVELKRNGETPTIMKRPLRILASVLFLGTLAPAATAQVPSQAATWELAMMGVSTDDLPRMREVAQRRPVELAVVGQSGVSESGLKAVLRNGTTLTYHDCSDPGPKSHDTGQLRVVLELTQALGVTVHLHVWQPGESWSDVADRFRQAAEIADVVVLYQSFWGTNAQLITDAISESPRALFVSPFVGYQSRHTNECPQGHAAKPWDDGSIKHFVTVTPLAKRSGDGRIVHPPARGDFDTEIINFIAPSYHASGPGGTCPAASVAAAVACYIVAARPEKSTPADIIDLLRRTSKIDRKALTSLPPFADAAIDTLESEIKSLAFPPEGTRRTLDATGVIHLGEVFREIAD